MKKYQINVLLMCLCVCSLAFISALYAGEIIYVEGSVQVQSGQQESWSKAEKGTKVNIGDKIRTARHSKADVALDDEKKNTIRIDPKTMVVLNSANPGLIDKLDLSHGRVYAKVENIKSGMAFEVATPSSVAGVRGSAFGVYAERDEDEIQAYKDSTFVQAYDANGKLITEMTLPEGFKTFVDRFEGPGSLIQVSLREFSRFDNVANEMSAHEQGKMEMRRERERERQGAGEQGKSEPFKEAGQETKTIEQLNDIKQQEKENTIDKTVDTTRDVEQHHEEYLW